MHIAEKEKAICKVAQLLNSNGRFVLSIDKNQDSFLTFNDSKLRLFPDQPAEIVQYINDTGLDLEQQIETEFAYILWLQKKVCLLIPNRYTQYNNQILFCDVCFVSHFHFRTYQ